MLRPVLILTADLEAPELTGWKIGKEKTKLDTVLHGAPHPLVPRALYLYNQYQRPKKLNEIRKSF